MSVVLCDLSDAEDIINEERDEWTKMVLDRMGVPEEVYGSNIDDFRYTMDQLGVEINLSTVGNVDIYKLVYYKDALGNEGWLEPKEEHLVAQWREPKRVKVIDEKKNVYYELHLNNWSSV